MAGRACCMLSMMRVLVIEDNDRIAAPLIDGWRGDGFGPNRVTTGARALCRSHADVVLLDPRSA